VRAARWPEAAEAVREKIGSGALKPGDPAPSGRELAAETGLPLTACQAALRSLKADGTLDRTAFPARLQVAQPGRPPSPEDEALGRALMRLREARGLTRRHLAVLLGVPLTVAEQAEAGRGGQDRGFWQRADGMLGAEGGLLHQYDAACAPVASGCSKGGSHVGVTQTVTTSDGITRTIRMCSKCGDAL
jgi:hypothetical protein